MARLYTFTMDVEVHHEAGLFLRAMEVAKEDGLSEQEALDLLKPEGEIDVGACLVMVLDPSAIPGCEIQESSAEAVEGVYEVDFGDERN